MCLNEEPNEHQETVSLLIYCFLIYFRTFKNPKPSSPGSGPSMIATSVLDDEKKQPIGQARSHRRSPRFLLSSLPCQGCTVKRTNTGEKTPAVREAVRLTTALARSSDRVVSGSHRPGRGVFPDPPLGLTPTESFAWHLANVASPPRVETKANVRQGQRVNFRGFAHESKLLSDSPFRSRPLVSTGRPPRCSRTSAAIKELQIKTGWEARDGTAAA